MDVAAWIVTQKMADNTASRLRLSTCPALPALSEPTSRAGRARRLHDWRSNDSTIMTMQPTQLKRCWDILHDLSRCRWLRLWNGVLSPPITLVQIRCRSYCCSKGGPGQDRLQFRRPGSPQHLADGVVRVCCRHFALRMLYKGATQAATDIATGQILVGFQGLGSSPRWSAGQLRLIGND